MKRFILLIAILLVQNVLSWDNGAGRLPPMGWSTWCTDDWVECVDDFCSEQEIRQIAKSMTESGMLAAGYNYINLDDCWAGPRDSNGRLTADTTRFPSGMPALIADMHKMGFKFGLYTCAGNFTCKYGRPGSWGHFDIDAQTFADWEVDYIKMDWCFHPALPPHTVYGMMSDSINKTGRSMFFEVCDWGEEDPWTWGDKVANSWRIGPDHLPFWWLPYTKQGTVDIIENLAGKGSFSGPGGWNYPDFLMTGALTMTWLQSRTEYTLWAITASPLIVTTDVRDMSNKADILLNSEVIAVNQDSLAVAGDRIAIIDGTGQVWTKPLSDGSFAFVFYNNATIESVDLSINWESLWPTIPPTESVSVRDLWAKKDLGAFASTFSMSIEAHGANMYRAARKSQQ